ncbi:tetratricopeptide repeat protein [Catenulispora pinisilvae]|uniref:tetratricopeptide repeat protein n=1 Tax=Catenulispora pinisilvae TaxID=2705253 RepID=UPI001E2E2619|nr:tetratricopeptide repeat protein [Catenulispora pinisilvae]
MHSDETGSLHRADFEGVGTLTDLGDGAANALSGFSGAEARIVMVNGNVAGGINLRPGTMVPRQLPRAPANFEDRNGERAKLKQVMVAGGRPGSCPVAVLSGPAGVGKTALALAWSHDVADQFADGQLYVNLHGYDYADPVAVSTAVRALLLGVGVDSSAIPSGLDERAALYRSVMARGKRLVLLDNASSPNQVQDLLPAAPDSFVLVTSRSAFGRWEEAHTVNVGLLPDAAAVALLRKVVGDVRGNDDSASLTELAKLCAFLPLALWIAGERLAAEPSTPLEVLIGELRDEATRLDALTSHARPPVRVVFDWSYRTLDSDTAAVFRALGVHPGIDFTAASVAALTGRTVRQTGTTLDALVRVHLLDRDPGGRYAFHDLLRAYAAELAQRVDGVDRTAQWQTAVIGWYLGTVCQAASAMGLDSLKLPEALATPFIAAFATFEDAGAWFETERPNLAAAVNVAASNGHDRLAWHLAGALLGVYEVNNHLDEWAAISQHGLEAARRLPDEFGEAVMLESLGKVCCARHELDLAERYQSESLALREKIGDVGGVVRSTNALGLVHWRARRYQEARTAFRHSLSLAQRSGDIAFQAFALQNLGGVDVEDGQFSDAIEPLTTAYEILRDAGMRVYEENALQDLAGALRGLGRFDDALAAARGAVDLATGLGNLPAAARALVELARVHRAMRQPDAALAEYAQATALHRRLRDHSREAISLDEAGEAQLEAGRYEQAAELHTIAAVMHRDLGDASREQRALANLQVAHERLNDPHRGEME